MSRSGRTPSTATTSSCTGPSPALLSLDATRGPGFEPVAYVDGLENPTENFTNICGWLVRHGFDDEEIRAVIGGNVYRALQAVWVSP